MRFIILFAVLFSMVSSTWSNENVLESKISEFKYTATDYETTVYEAVNKNFDRKLTPQIGYVDSLIWINFSVENTKSFDEKYLFIIKYPLLNYVDFYQFIDGELVKEINTGDNRAFSSREVQNRHFVFEVDAKKHSKTEVYIRINNEGDTVILPTEIIRADESYNEDTTLILILGLLYGVFFFTILFNILMLFYIRSRLFLYYTFYILFTFLFLSYTDGLIFQYIFPHSILLNEFSITFYVFSGLIFMLMFFIDYFDIRKSMKLLYKTTMGIIGLGVVLTVVSFFNKDALYAVLQFTGLYALIVMILIIITSSYLMLKKQNKFAIFFLVSITFWVIGLVIYLLRDFGVVPDNFFTLHSIKFGVAIEVSLMSILLILRYRTILNDTNEKLKQQNKLLVLAKQQAEASDKLKTMFLNNLSHEIRTPLNGIVGFSELLTTEGVEAEDAARFSEIISDNAFYLTDIVEDILAISSIELGDYRLTFTEGNLRENLEECEPVLQKLKARFDNNNTLYVQNNIPEDLVKSFDLIKTPILVAHLVSNALKFTQNGEVRVEYAYVNSNLIINVSDTGIGIPEDSKSKIFNQFFKVESVKFAYRGNGLGLAIVKRIVELYGGNIELFSAPDEGTEIKIELPLQ